MFRLSAAIGIDIGTTSVRVALIQKRGRTTQLKALICESTQGRTLEDTLINIKKKLKKEHKLLWFFIQHQVFGIPQSNVAVKRLAVGLDVHEQEKYTQVGLQLAESLGLPIDELLYDFRPLPENNGVEVYVCRRAVIENSLNALALAGYHLSVIELQTHALMRLYKQQMTHCARIESSLMLDVGSERVQICAGDGRSGQFFRELPLPLKTQSISEPEVVSIFTGQLIEIIQRQYQVAATSVAGAHINRIWLSGENAKYVDTLLLEKRLGWEVKTLNPLHRLTCSPHLIENLSESASAWSIAIGLALGEDE